MTEQADRAPGTSDVALPTVPLSRCGIWLLTTRSGTRILLATVLNPDTGEPFTTVTRYAPEGQGAHLNGEPMTVRPLNAPAVGERWDVEVVRLHHRTPWTSEVFASLPRTRYCTTELTRIVELSYELVSNMVTAVYEAD
ncbi:hypothetical protein [Glaciibacter psychrotolerans]|uniref:Uncharacterized protein n=1 Tax=Glaciibacter psychrotolerans TaxID=670054 RepID=A0A7Z0ECH4_9MICO|nr:hypothetical protein [Leifsonia psychrotolerans]NYJ18479.1 hypothetical protein [Leifsonia psychrotolerans]